MFGLEILSGRRLTDDPFEDRQMAHLEGGYTVLQRCVAVGSTGHVQPLIRVWLPIPIYGFLCGVWMADRSDRSVLPRAPETVCDPKDRVLPELDRSRNSCDRWSRP